MKTRIISAIIMIMIVVPVLITGGTVFKVFASALGICSLYEIMKVRKKDSEIPLVIRLISYLMIGLFIFLGTTVYSSEYEMIYKILIVLFLIYFIPVVFINDTKKYNIKDALYVLGSSIFIGIAFNSCVMIMNKSISNLIYILLVTTCTDTFAYFGGYFIGRHKLCEKISPKKTIEGAVVGTIVGTVIACIYYVFVINYSANLFIIIPITLLLSAIGQVGDLFFSSIKRQYGVKDYSNLIAGHGGILDRLDSIIFVVLTYILFMNII